MLLQYGYLLLIVGLLIDALGIPFPGDLLLLAAGFLVSQGYFSLMLALPLACAAVLIGDSITFALGKAVCRAEGTFLYRLYCRWTRCTLASRECFRRSCGAFESLGKKSIVVSKFMWGTREFIPPLAGLSGMRYDQFLGLDALGVFLWVVSLMFLGHFLGNQAAEVLGTIENFALELALSFALGYAMIFALRKRKKWMQHGKIDPMMTITAGLSKPGSHRRKENVDPAR